MADETPHEQPPRQHHDRGSYPRHRPDHNNPQSRPAQVQQPPQQPGGENLDAAEDEEEQAESRRRSHGSGHHRGGKPAKKVYEEWANDPYCE